MRKLYIYLLLLLSCTAVQAQKKPDLKALEKYMTDAMVKLEVPGMAVAIIKDDSVVMSKGFGKRVYNQDKPVNDKTLFAIASNTKAFTAAALGTLVTEKKLNWSDKVINHIPYFQLYDAYSTREMTVRDLLCHRSGLATFGGDLMWYGTNYTREQVIKSAKYLKPVSSFRSQYGYQNLMFITAGEIVPVVSGMSFDNLLKERFFKPLGMTLTNTSIKEFKGNDNVAMPHTKVNGKIDSVYYKSWDNMGGAGNINSCVADMSQWVRMWLNKGNYKGKQILDEKIWRDITSANTVIGVSEAAEKFIPYRHFVEYGLGFRLYDYKGYKVVEHGGAADGMISMVCMVPELKLGMVILTNSINSLPTALGFKIIDTYLNDSKDDWAAKFQERLKKGEEAEKEEMKKLKDSQVQNTKPSLALEKYAGTYSGPMYGEAEVKVQGQQLIIDLKPTSTFKGTLTHWHYDTFRIRLNDKNLPEGFVQFVIDTNGNVSEMKIDIPNPDFDFTELEFKKIK